VPPLNRPREFQKPVGQSRLAVVNVRDDAKVADVLLVVFHMPLLYQRRGLRRELDSQADISRKNHKLFYIKLERTLVQWR